MTALLELMADIMTLRQYMYHGKTALEISGPNHEVMHALRELMMLCAARQRLALAVGIHDEGHLLINTLPFALLHRVCEEAEVESALLGCTEFRMRRIRSRGSGAVRGMDARGIELCWPSPGEMLRAVHHSPLSGGRLYHVRTVPLYYHCWYHA